MQPAQPFWLGELPAQEDVPGVMGVECRWGLGWEEWHCTEGGDSGVEDVRGQLCLGPTALRSAPLAIAPTAPRSALTTALPGVTAASF